MERKQSNYFPDQKWLQERLSFIYSRQPAQPANCSAIHPTPSHIITFLNHQWSNNFAFNAILGVRLYDVPSAKSLSGLRSSCDVLARCKGKTDVGRTERTLVHVCWVERNNVSLGIGHSRRLGCYLSGRDNVAGDQIWRKLHKLWCFRVIRHGENVPSRRSGIATGPAMARATRDKRATIENCMIAMCLVIGERFRKEWIGRWSKESSGDKGMAD